MDQDTVQNLIDGEQSLLSEAPRKYGDYFAHSINFGEFMGRFLLSIDPDRYIFAAFLSQVRKNYFLALFSALRLHHVQAGMDMRQLLESGAWAGYAIANPEQEKYAVHEGGALTVPEKLFVARNKWLEKHFKDGSDGLKRLKNLINESVAHANIVYALSSFRLNVRSGQFETPYFDFEDRYIVKSDLWLMSNIAYGLLDLFFGINRPLNAIKLIPEFASELLILRKENDRLKSEMQKGRAASDPRPDRGVTKN